MHGWNDDPTNVWIDWLASELESRGYVVETPTMPNPHVPRPAKWLVALAQATGELDENTTLVAHSLGSPTVLRLLDDYPKDVRIAGLVLVAGFGDGVLERPGAFFHPPLDFNRITSRARTRVCIYSDNDPVVSPRRTKRLAMWLGAREVVVLGAGHFTGSSHLRGTIDQLPAALEAVLSCYPQTIWQRLDSIMRKIAR